MNKITVNKVVGYKKWMPVEVIEGSDEHLEILRWNRAKNFQLKQDRKEMRRQNEIAENEVSYEQRQEETGFEIIDEDEPSPEEWYIRNELKRILDDAISELPENQREIVILHFYHGISLREIAKSKGKRLFTVQKSCQSALDKLRENPILKNFLRNFS